MHQLSQIARTAELDRPQTVSAELDLARVSGPPPNISQVQAVTALMGQVEARYPHQELDPLTTRMYMAEWLEMAAVYGESRLAESLRVILRERERPNFFPTPNEIRDVCRAAARAERDRRETARLLAEHDAAKAQWERERAEDLANGIVREPPPVRSPRRVLRGAEPRHSDEQIAAFIAQHVTPEEAAAMRERMSTLMEQR